MKVTVDVSSDGEPTEVLFNDLKLSDIGNPIEVTYSEKRRVPNNASGPYVDFNVRRSGVLLSIQKLNSEDSQDVEFITVDFGASPQTYSSPVNHKSVLSNTNNERKATVLR